MKLTAPRAVLGVILVAAILLGWFVLVPRDYYTGSNATRLRGTLLELNQRDNRLCLPGLRIPAGTGRMEFELDTATIPRAPMRFRLATGGSRFRDELPAGPAGRQKVAFDFPVTDRDGGPQTGRACITIAGPGKLFFGGVPGIPPGEQAPSIDGRAQDARASIWYRPPAGERASAVSQLGTLFERMALFRASWTGTWTLWLLFLVVGPLLVFAALRLVLRPGRRRRVPLVLLVGLLGFGHAAAWAHITPTFNAPDESEHFAYLQSLAERGKALESGSTGRPTYSSQESLLITMTRALDGAETADGKPPWDRREQDVYEELLREDPPADDGGGYTPAGSTHSPLFYALGVPAYELAGADPVDKLVAVRLVDALLGGIVAALAFLIVLELFPGRRDVAVLAGVAVAFQPMFAFMMGSYNNDVGVNAVAAGVTFLLIRLLRRGFTWPVVGGLGVLVALAPIVKGTGYALFPAAILAVALAAWRSRAQWRRWLPRLAVLALGFVVVTVGYAQISDGFDRGSFTTPGGALPGEGTLAVQDPKGAVSYVWQVFLPRLPFMTDLWTQDWPAWNIYGKRAWGAFGWYAVTWPDVVYTVIVVLVGLLALLGARGLWVRRDVLAARWAELLTLLAVVAGVVGVMLVAYFAQQPQGDTYPIQGRYVFPAMIALAALLAGATRGAGRRLAGPLGAALTASVVALGYASWWLVLVSFYFAA